MPVLANARHEQFAQKVASGLKLLEAYTLAGYSEAGAQSSASRLARNAKVAARIAELEAASAQASTAAVLFDRARVLARLDELSRKAEAEGNFSAAIRAEELIGRNRGMFIDRTEHFTWSGRLEDLDDAQLEAYRQSVARQYGLSLEDEPQPVNGHGKPS